MDWVGGNFWLNQSQMELNATYIWNYLHSLGWTTNAISGMLGNMETESSINPAIWQNLDEGNLELGYGLVQWTPATKFLDWCAANNLQPDQMNSNLERIIWELNNNAQWIPTSTYNYSFYEFSQSTESPYDLGLAFLACYERPQDPNQPVRGTQANAWYTFLSGLTPPTPPTKKRKLPIYYYLRKE